MNNDGHGPRAHGVPQGNPDRPAQELLRPANYLEIGLTADGREVVINHPDVQVDRAGVGHIVFSPAQARHLAKLLLRKADQCKQ